MVFFGVQRKPTTVQKFRFHSGEINESSAGQCEGSQREVFPDTESIVDWYALQAPLRSPMTYCALKEEYEKLLKAYEHRRMELEKNSQVDHKRQPAISDKQDSSSNDEMSSVTDLSWTAEISSIKDLS